MRFRTYILKRLILLFPTLLGVTFFTYFISQYAGVPLFGLLSEDQMDRMSDEELAAFEHKMGLDQPWYIRYLIFLQSLLGGLIAFVAGEDISQFDGFHAFSQLMNLFPATAELAICSFLLALVLGIPIGVYSAVRQGSKKAGVLRIFTYLGMGIPVYVLAFFTKMTVIYGSHFLDQIFDFQSWVKFSDLIPYQLRYSVSLYTYPSEILFGILPPTNFLLIDSFLSFNIPLFFDALLHLLLPAGVIAVGNTALIARMTADSMRGVLKRDYIILARSKGLTERTIIYRHALKNSLFPVLTSAGLLLASLFTGIVFVEYLFLWPGVAHLTVVAILNLHMDTVMSFVILTALLYILCNLVVDLTYGWIDPRVRDIK
jgi:peptide/nickel transport system permease protein